MSDFLSNFNKDNYAAEKKISERPVEEQQEKQEPAAPEESSPAAAETEPKNRRSRHSEEETEFDPSFKKRQRKKRQLIAGGIMLMGVLLFFLYYQMTHVKLPDFSGKEIAEARTWAAENNVKLDLDQVYDKVVEVNQVIEQKQKAGKKVKKGSTIQLTASMGADPEEQLTVPDVMSMSKSEVENWIKEQKAENVSLIEEYSDDIEAGKPIKMEFSSKEVTAENYLRKDKLKIYFSKGKETFEKDITVKNFVEKAKSEVEEWAKTNEIAMTYEEVASDKIQEGMIVSQSVAADQKIAKRDKMTVTVSVGKGYVVPNFAEYTPEEAASAVEGLQTQVKSLYTEGVPYGQLVSQSVEAGTELTAKDNLKVSVVYSAGQPYIKDLRGTAEGDLPKLFYDDYTAKGAAISYQVNYVDSAEVKGTVVASSVMNEYLPLTYTVYLDVSLGNLQGAQQYSGSGGTGSGDSDGSGETGSGGSEAGDSEQPGE